MSGFDTPRQTWQCNVDLPAGCPHSVGVIAGNCRRKVPAVSPGLGAWLQMTSTIVLSCMGYQRLSEQFLNIFSSILSSICTSCNYAYYLSYMKHLFCLMPLMAYMYQFINFVCSSINEKHILILLV